MSQERSLLDLHVGRATQDGDGVRMTRVFAGRGVERFDPFLMLDQFDTEKPGDYIGGFPAHPHRGFETVTYMLEGRIRHQDHLGNSGLLLPGGVQWMTAARGIIHSEMPEQQDGAMRGFQLWLNLPAHAKMQPAEYRDYAPDEVPRLTLDTGVEVVVIAGRFSDGARQLDGAVQRPDTEPLYLDIRLPAGAQVSPEIPAGHNALLYVYEGEAQLGADAGVALPHNRLARLSDGGALHLSSRDGARLLLIAGKPLGEPIVQYGPFVMNTQEEIEQALEDFRSGSFG